MSLFTKFKEQWLQPFLYLGRNTLSLVGGALTTASAFVMVGFWMVEVLGHGGSGNPYIGILIFLLLPGVFIVGLVLIPIGIFIRRRELLAAGSLPSRYPKVDFADPIFRHALDFVIIATFVNFIIVGVASYRGVAYMDSPQFCGTSCHTPMQPQWVAYQNSPHSHVDCVACHVGSGAGNYIHAKAAGIKQLVGVTFNTFPRPIRADLSDLRPARATCEECHTPTRFLGDKLLVKTEYGDDEKNTMTKTILALHLGGQDSLSNRSGIHGHHLDHFEYVATDSSDQTILEVDAKEADGSITQYVSTDAKGPVKGVRRTMDCMDCHNQATHVFHTAQGAVDQAMTNGLASPDLPMLHKEGLALIQTTYSSQDEAAKKIQSGLEAFYKSQYPAIWASQHEKVEQAAVSLVNIYKQNVFPDMKVTWGTYPNNIGHTDFPGCFRCHDGNHTSKSGKTITNDCSACHNLLAVQEPDPKLLTTLGFQ